MKLESLKTFFFTMNRISIEYREARRILCVSKNIKDDCQQPQRKIEHVKGY